MFPADESGKCKLEKGYSLVDTWRAMESLVDQGLVKHIGVSNYTQALLIDLLNYCRIKPYCNQIEVHPYL